MMEEVNEPAKEGSSQGILIAAALIMAAIYVLTGNHKHFSVTLHRENLPKIVRDKMPCDVKAIMITSTYVSLDLDDWTPLSTNALGAIAMNKLKDFLAKHDN
jgi:hypothetical protein